MTTQELIENLVKLSEENRKKIIRFVQASREGDYGTPIAGEINVHESDVTVYVYA